jgi:hypothetical protein
MATIAHRIGTLIHSSPMVLRHTPPQDVELASRAQQDAPPEPPPSLRGFPSLSAFMSDNAHSESFLFQRFDRLAARNLLYMQSELAELQKKMDEFDKQDAQPPHDLDARRCARSWTDFERIKSSNSKQQERWALMMKIRETLREYRKCSKDIHTSNSTPSRSIHLIKQKQKKP